MNGAFIAAIQYRLGHVIIIQLAERNQEHLPFFLPKSNLTCIDNILGFFYLNHLSFLIIVYTSPTCRSACNIARLKFRFVPRRQSLCLTCSRDILPGSPPTCSNSRCLSRENVTVRSSQVSVTGAVSDEWRFSVKPCGTKQTFTTLTSHPVVQRCDWCVFVS